jgi:hypothetical protein
LLISFTESGLTRGQNYASTAAGAFRFPDGTEICGAIEPD